MGSILGSSTGSSTVLGSGLISVPLPNSNPITFNRVVAVRGKLTLDQLGNLCHDVQLGDPMVLINLIMPTTNDRSIEFGLIPHESNVAHYDNVYSRKFTIIDPRLEPIEVIRRISCCKRLVSQSLHGLIVADALNIPNVWLEPSQNIVGGRFKFNDYFTTVDGNTESISLLELDGGNPNAFLYDVRDFKFNKLDYRSFLIDAMNCLGKGVHESSYTI